MAAFIYINARVLSRLAENLSASFQPTTSQHTQNDINQPIRWEECTEDQLIELESTYLDPGPANEGKDEESVYEGEQE